VAHDTVATAAIIQDGTLFVLRGGTQETAAVAERHEKRPRHVVRSIRRKKNPATGLTGGRMNRLE
jgi:hypothetical protein